MALSRGSEWSRWDLHIHTPFSIENCYGGDTDEVWEKFITALEGLPRDVKVIGINDYYFIEGYERVMKYRKKGRLQNFEKIFPVLEFRIDKFSSASKTDMQKVNFHVLFNIDNDNVDSGIQKIKDEFLNLLKITGLEQHKTKLLTKQNLIDYSPKKTLLSGFSELIPSYDAVIDLLDSETWAKETFKFLGYKEWYNMDFGAQLKLYKKDLFDRVDAFFTASPSHEQTKKQEKIELFGDKPLVHSMDIHDFSNLEPNNYKCFTWIKSDYTLNGLNQIKYEPKERIKICFSNPIYEETKTNVISSIKFRNSNQWFTEEEIKLNRGLVAIIGEKGSGKTALLDMLAISNNEGIFEADIMNPSSFYFRVKKDNKLGLIESEVKQEGIEETNKVKISELDVPSRTSSEGKVRYLSLKELENYSIDKSQLQFFIKDIINSNDTTIKDLVNKCIRYSDRIETSNRAIASFKEKLQEKKVKESAYESKRTEYLAVVKLEPQNESSFDKESEQKFKELLQRESEIEMKQKTLDEKNIEINLFYDWLKEKVKETQRTIQEEIKERAGEYDHILKFIEDNIKIDIVLKGDISLQDEISKLIAEKDNLKCELLNIEEQLTPLKIINQNYQEEQKIQKNWLTKKTALEKEISILKTDLERFEQNEIALNEENRLRQEDFIDLLKFKLEQKDKYILMKSQVEEGLISFDVTIEFDKVRFEKYEDAYINHGSGYNQDDVLKHFYSLYTNLVENLQYMSSSDENLEEALYRICEPLFKCDDLQAFIKEYLGKNDDKKLLKQTVGLEQFYNMLFYDYYTVDYNIKFNNKSLNLLSPGQKGLVLMKLFLRLDKSSKPILIDQPEDNLDNKSVYNDLKDDIRAIKERRQIIIATHNPNLVVNTDAEQVIVAKFEDIEGDEGVRIHYQSGGLEDDSIRELVCDILEGGEIAFTKREERYNFSN